jgi:hypothetical protein
MPRDPPIRDLKLAAGFTPENGDIYRSWRKEVWHQLEVRKILATSNPGAVAWAELTGWALTRVPLSERAAIHGGTSTEAVEFTVAVRGLLKDVLKKLNHSRLNKVNLDPPSAPTTPVQGSS